AARIRRIRVGSSQELQHQIRGDDYRPGSQGRPARAGAQIHRGPRAIPAHRNVDRPGWRLSLAAEIAPAIERLSIGGVHECTGESAFCYRGFGAYEAAQGRQEGAPGARTRFGRKVTGLREVQTTAMLRTTRDADLGIGVHCGIAEAE